jgi:hypothetical protein
MEIASTWWGVQLAERNNYVRTIVRPTITAMPKKNRLISLLMRLNRFSVQTSAITAQYVYSG